MGKLCHGVGIEETDKDTISLGQLSGAVLVYEDANGDDVIVQFDE